MSKSTFKNDVLDKFESFIDGEIKRLSENPSFTDSLLAAQKNKINDLESRLLNLDSAFIDKIHLSKVRGREISRLNKIIHDKNEMIRNLISSRGEIARKLSAEKAVHQVDLQATKSAESALLYHEREYEKSLKEKDEVIDAISDELSNSKKREQELIETVKDYQEELNRLKSSSNRCNHDVKKKKKSKRKKSSLHQGIHVVVDDVVIPNDMYELLDFIFE